MVKQIDRTKLLAWLWDTQQQAESEARVVSDKEFPTFVAHQVSRYGSAMQIRFLIDAGEFDDKGEYGDSVEQYRGAWSDWVI